MVRACCVDGQIARLNGLEAAAQHRTQLWPIQQCFQPPEMTSTSLSVPHRTVPARATYVVHVGISALGQQKNLETQCYMSHNQQPHQYIAQPSDHVSDSISHSFSPVKWSIGLQQASLSVSNSTADWVSPPGRRGVKTCRCCGFPNSDQHEKIVVSHYGLVVGFRCPLASLSARQVLACPGQTYQNKEPFLTI